MTKKQPLRILLSNDDGIHAPGLEILEKIARQLTDDIWIVAPDQDHSGAGHSLTLKNPLRMRELTDRKFAISGTPTDCIVMALKHLMLESPPDLILSGINKGANLAQDVTYSGTVAAAMEGTLLGVPSIALSQHHLSGHPVKWSTALDHAPQLIEKIIENGIPKDVLININFPDAVSKGVKGVEVTHQGTRAPFASILKRIDPRESAYYWIGAIPDVLTEDEDTDLMAIQNHFISVTPLHLDLTHYETLKKLKTVLE